MAPIDDVESSSTPDNSSRVGRPAAHEGLGDELPPLQPCYDARTPLEACRLPITGEDKPSHGDILERLKTLQEAEASACTGSERHWGVAEERAKNVLETLSHSSGEPHDFVEAHSEMLEALGDARAVAVDSDGFTLLHYASMYGSVDAVAALVRKRANVNTRTKVHETPLQLAAYYRHAEVCAVLLAHRARPDLADWQGRTPLAAAMASKCGHGRDNNGQAQAQCIELLRDRWEQDKQCPAIKDAEDLRKQGNTFFQAGQLNEAIAAYSVGLASWDDSLIYANRAECYLKQQRFLEAKLDAKKALGLAGEGGSKKAAWRLGRACLALGELDQATEAATQGLARCPEDAALRQLRTDIERERRRRLGH